MKINAVLVHAPKRPRKRRNVGASLNRPDNALICVFCCMLAGLLCGAMLFVTEKDLFSTGLLERYLTFTSSLGSRSFLELWSGFLAQNLLLWALLLFCGTSAFGAAVVLPAVTIKSAGLSAVAAFFIHAGTQGIGYYFLCLFPGKVLLLPGLLPAAHHALRLSARIRGRLNRESGAEPRLLQRYVMLFLFALLFFVLASLLDAVLMKTCARLFTLPFSAAD